MATSALTERIEREIEQQTGLQVIVEETGNALLLSGLIDSPAAGQAAEDIARGLAPDRPITTSFDMEATYPQPVGGVLPDDLSEANLATEGVDNLPEDADEIARVGGEVEPDFTEQRLDTTGIEDFAEPLPLDPDTVDILDETENVVTPPTDPVITGGGETTQVLGGFEATADDGIGTARSASDGQYGDEAIADAVRQALRLDASTTDLRIQVDVVDGVVRLRGGVPGLEDADNAEEVASRVPGVQEVNEELRVG